MTNLKLFLSIILITGLVNANQIDCLDYSSWGNQIKGSIPEECSESVKKFLKSCESETAETTAGSVNRVGAELQCLKQVLNKELNKRLLSLKKDDPKQFKSEMKIQKFFNLAAKKACAKFNNCQGSMYRVTDIECQLSLTNWRLDQAKAINLHNLSLKSKSNKTSTELSNVAELKTFSSQFCKMPKSVFQDGQLPVDCQKSVRTEFEIALGENCNSID